MLIDRASVLAAHPALLLLLLALILIALVLRRPPLRLGPRRRRGRLLCGPVRFACLRAERGYLD
ncbi:MAG: hypothetical protein JF888_09900 [Candidatus Dormibacteraeota bacterium]|uniref:Uncharacterized protein n=1 Tax=Candidatus Dormiibacter inghamiae TaxID=3127013 RepID=A0A934NE18_9BACT|nr:hypothetical protein [Candidatus Dormibacteraeota bacterium]